MYEQNLKMAYQQWIDRAAHFENNDHYSNIMCLKETKRGPNAIDPSEYLINSEVLPGRANLRKRCVLPKNHDGACECHMNSLFRAALQTKKLTKSIDQAINTTPGADDYVIKNRASRLFPYVLSSQEEQAIRDKNIKKKCAVALAEATTPILMAQAYLDWLVFVINVHDVNTILDTTGPEFNNLRAYLDAHKAYLVGRFPTRNIFDREGYTICVVTQIRCNLVDFTDTGRDNRVNISDTDVQMGHNVPKSDLEPSIRGSNLFPMSRRGNEIIGTRVYTQNGWINELARLLAAQQLHN